jgi:hypothetical protein
VYTIIQTHLCSAGYAPRLQRQGLNSHHRRLDVSPESDYTYDNAQDIHNVVTIGRNLVDTATVAASVLVCLTSTRKGLGNRCAFKKISLGRVSGWQTGGCSKHVDSLEDEEAWESATKVGNAGLILAKHLVNKGVKCDLRSKKRHVGSANDWI